MVLCSEWCDFENAVSEDVKHHKAIDVDNPDLTVALFRKRSGNQFTHNGKAPGPEVS